LRNREADLLPRRDLDRFAGLRVAAHAGLHLAETEDAEAWDLDRLPLLHGLAASIDERRQQHIGLLLRDVSGRREFLQQLGLRHLRTPPPQTVNLSCLKRRARRLLRK